MAIFDYFRAKKKNTASLAKERLQIIVAHERKGRSPEYLPQLKRDILEVVNKYVKISEKDITLEVDKDGDLNVLELNVTLNEK